MKPGPRASGLGAALAFALLGGGCRSGVSVGEGKPAEGDGGGARDAGADDGGRGGDGVDETRCDGLDSDADGETDEGCDSDADGWCDGESEVEGEPAACPAGGGDCDDEDRNVRPDADEACNDADDDCDGEVDEGDNPCGGVCDLDAEPGAPCDGPDADLCEDDQWECAGRNAVACSTGEDNEDPLGPLDLLIGPEYADDADDVGEFPDLAVDADGRPHVSYRDEGLKDLRYARREGVRWDIAALAAGDIGRHTSIALAEDGTAHIVFRDVGAAALAYIARADGEWAPPDAVVIDGTAAGQYSSIARDPETGALHVVYHQNGSRDLNYAACAADCGAAAGWTIVVVDADGDAGRFASLALDPASGALHASYRHQNSRALRYATCRAECTRAESWTTVTVDDPTSSVAEGTSIALGDGRPHVAYYDETARLLKHASCDDGCGDPLGWTIEVTPNDDASTEYGRAASIGVTPLGDAAASDRVHVSYYDRSAGGGRLEHLVRDRGVWTAFVLDDPAVEDVGEFTALALDPRAGSPERRTVHVAYRDGTRKSLKYVHFDPNADDADCDGW